MGWRDWSDMGEARELFSATIGDVIGAVFTMASGMSNGRADAPILDVTPERAKELGRMKYEDYMKTEEWRERAARIKWASGRKCELCENPEPPLDVHHLTYERRGNEWASDLMALCRKCHFTAHRMAS